MFFVFLNIIEKKEKCISVLLLFESLFKVSGCFESLFWVSITNPIGFWKQISKHYLIMLTRFKVWTYLFNEVKVTWTDFALLWIFRIASTMLVDVSTDTIDAFDATDDDDGDAVDIVDDLPPHDEDDVVDDDEARIGLLCRYVMHSGSHQACRSRHHSLTGLVLTKLKINQRDNFKTTNWTIWCQWVNWQGVCYQNIRLKSWISWLMNFDIFWYERFG